MLLHARLWDTQLGDTTDTTPAPGFMLHAAQGLPLAQEAHGKEVEAVATDDRCARSPYSTYLDPHRLVIRTPPPWPPCRIWPKESSPLHLEGHFPEHEFIKSSDGQWPFSYRGSHWPLEPEDSRTSCPLSAFCRQRNWDRGYVSRSRGTPGITSKLPEASREASSKLSSPASTLMQCLFPPEL